MQKTHSIKESNGIPQVREQMCLVCAAAHNKGKKEGVPARRPKSFNLYDWHFKDTCRKSGWLPPAITLVYKCSRQQKDTTPLF